MPEKPFPEWLVLKMLGIETVIGLSKDGFVRGYNIRKPEMYYPRRLGVLEGLYKALLMDLTDAGYLPWKER